MADISGKETTHRVAIAGGRIRIGRKAYSLLEAGEMPKGDPDGRLHGFQVWANLPEARQMTGLG